jgi:hypothetical protein
MFPGGSLKGGISIKQVPGGTGRPDSSTVSFLRLRGKGVGNGSLWVGLWCWVVFGTLLGPGTTTFPCAPFLVGVCGGGWLFHGFPVHDRLPGGADGSLGLFAWGVLVSCGGGVWWGCCLRTI